MDVMSGFLALDVRIFFSLTAEVTMRLGDRWGHDTMNFGYTAIPNLLLRWNGFKRPLNSQRLSPTEIVVLTIIISYWIDDRPMPFPSIKRIALYAGLIERHTRRVIKELSRRGLIKVKRHFDGYDDRRNMYDLTPLIQTLRDVARAADEQVKNVRQYARTRLELSEAIGVIGDDPERS